MQKANSVLEAVRNELPYYPGVQMDARDRGGNHRKLTFTHGDRSRFIVIPRSPSDWRAPKNAISQLRKTMEELGAERVGEPVANDTSRAAPANRASRFKRGKVATVSLRDNLFVVHIGAASKLIRRFATPDGKRPVAHWKIELSPSPDLTAPPLIVMKKVEVADGSKHPGVVAGFAVKGGSWRITVRRNQIPALSRLPNFKGTGVRLYEDRGNELVFQLPAGTVPTGFRKPDAAPLPSEAWAEPKAKAIEAKAPEPVEAATPAAAPTVELGDRPLVLQMPKQTVSVEAAIGILNKAKRRLGDSLRFTVVEGGYLTAVHRIGH